MHADRDDGDDTSRVDGGDTAWYGLGAAFYWLVLATTSLEQVESTARRWAQWRVQARSTLASKIHSKPTLTSVDVSSSPFSAFDKFIPSPFQIPPQTHQPSLHKPPLVPLSSLPRPRPIPPTSQNIESRWRLYHDLLILISAISIEYQDYSTLSISWVSKRSDGYT